MKIKRIFVLTRSIGLSIVLLGNVAMTVHSQTDEPKQSSRKGGTYKKSDQKDKTDPDDRTQTKHARGSKSASGAQPFKMEAIKSIYALTEIENIRISPSVERKLIDKYINEAEGNPLFWSILEEYVTEAKLAYLEKETPKSGTTSASTKGEREEPKHEKRQKLESRPSSARGSSVTSEDVGGNKRASEDPLDVDLVGFLGLRWEQVIMSSEPSGAEVWLEGKIKSREGETLVRRKYPEGTYTFIIRKDGYKPASIVVNVLKGKPVEETVVLEKQ